MPSPRRGPPTGQCDRGLGQGTRSHGDFRALPRGTRGVASILPEPLLSTRENAARLPEANGRVIKDFTPCAFEEVLNIGSGSRVSVVLQSIPPATRFF